MLPSYGNQASGARTWPGVSVKHLVQSKCPPWHQACLGPVLDLFFLPFPTCLLPKSENAAAENDVIGLLNACIWTIGESTLL